MSAAVFGYLDQAVIGPSIEQAFLLGGFGQHRYVAVESSRDGLIDRVRAPDFSHHRNCIAIELAAQVGTDHLPGVAAIVGTEDVVAGHVDSGVRIRADNKGRVPVPALRHFTFAFLGLYAEAFAGGFVETHNRAVLRFGVNGVGIFRVNQRTEAAASLSDEPILADDAGDVPRAGRAAGRIVVLRATVDKVKRFGGGDRHVVKLTGGQIVHISPAPTGVARRV